MTYVSSSVPNLINGISQQPSAFKLATQAEHQLNGVSSVVKGLIKRPPTEHKAKFTTNDISLDSFVHTLDYGLGEYYTVVISTESLAVYDKDGAVVQLDALDELDNPVSVDSLYDPLSYLSNLSNPRDELVATTIADQTYIINKNTLVAKATDLTPDRPYEGLIYVKQGDYKTEYKVNVTAHTLTQTITLDGTWASGDTLHLSVGLNGLNFTSTSSDLPTIATALKAAIDGDTNFSGWFEVTTDGGVLTLTEEGDEPVNLIVGVAQTVGDGTAEGTETALQPTTHSYTYTTRDSTDVLHEPDIQTTHIANMLYTAMAHGANATIQGTPWLKTSAYTKGSYVDYGGETYQALKDMVYPTRDNVSADQRRNLTQIQKQYQRPPNNSTRSSYWAWVDTSPKNDLTLLPEGIHVSLHGNTIRLWSTTHDFKLEATDDRGGTHMLYYKGQEADFKKLPPEGPLGFKLRIIGNNEKQQDDYYVQLEDPEGNGKPVWKETTADSLEYLIDSHTMPHVLIKEPNGSFHFTARDWDARKVGDEDTNPFPSFIGQNVNDLFIYRNRLGLLSGENVTLSEVGSFWNFFHATTLILSDAATIDVAVSTDKANILKHAVPFSSSLMLFSDTAQFTLRSGQVLAHDTVQVDVATRFEADMRCKPVGAATFVFFATKRGEFGGLREYYVAEDAEVKDAENVTSHVPELIEGAPKSLSVSNSEDMLLMLSTESPNEIYVYNYFWVNKEKKQSAWHKWDLGDPVISASFVESKLVLIINRDSGPCIEVMDLSSDITASSMGYGHGLHLDRRVALITDEDADNDPHSGSASAHYYNQEGANLGTSLTATQVKEWIALGDTVYAGFPYPFEYRFSEFILRSEGKPITPTKLKLKKLSIEYDETGSFEVEVTPSTTTNSTRPPYTKQFSPIIGSISNVLNKVNIDSGKFSVPIWGDATAIRVTLKNESVYPCSFQTAEWTATYTKHARAI